VQEQYFTGTAQAAAVGMVAVQVIIRVPQVMWLAVAVVRDIVEALRMAFVSQTQEVVLPRHITLPLTAMLQV
jgi:hypothetical protein